MQRSEFLRMLAILGIGAPLLSRCGSSNPKSILQTNEKVIVVGAGAAGLTAAYLLRKKGIEVTVLEASDTYGGRIESVKDFADFTIPLGAEWLHTSEPVLEAIVDDPSVKIDVQMTAYNFENDYCLDAATGRKMNLKEMHMTKHDLRFVNASWIDFFEQYILPSIGSNIQYNQIVQSIDYSADLVSVTTNQGIHTANRVIVTAPVTILKAGDIQFTPALPPKKQQALENLDLYDGFKCFIAFKAPFYPTFVRIKDEGKGPTCAYFNASQDKKSNDHILGLVAVGKYAQPYLELQEPDRINYILQELDELFDGQASANYLKHVFKNWSADPFAKGTYFPDFSLKIMSAIKEMSRPVEDKLFFAGDLYTEGISYSMVHVAAESAQKVVKQLAG
ncbi:MAG: NAD(P)/FAD-dependent oxidoreductase [Bacteroidota bacterium]